MRIEYGNVILNIPKSGIYVLGSNGGTGKTYAYKLLQGFSTINDVKFYLCSYSAKMYISEICKELKSQLWDLVFFDRADLYYCTELVDTLNSINSIVLIDIKAYDLKHLNFSYADVHINEKGVEIIS